MAQKRTDSTRRHFLGLSAAVAGKLTAAAVAVSSVVTPSVAKAMGRKKPPKGGGGNGGGRPSMGGGGNSGGNNGGGNVIGSRPRRG